MEEELDTSWIKEYQDKEKNYNEFYKEPVSSIKLFFIYVNKDNIIEFLKKEDKILNNNSISREELIKIIKEKQIVGEYKYKLISLLKYNIDIDPENIEDMLYNDSYNENFLNIEKNLDTIKFNDTIRILQDLNSIYLIFYPIIKSKKDTKRIIFNKKNHKTRRKTA
tara:strand:+ start:1557 stop:2054 length:498 start_codon:yes stop_codon:yes gene_type:complete